MNAILNEQEAAKAFSRQAPIFDDYDAGNKIIHYKRKRVRSQVIDHLPRGSRILELNAGTGLDAIHFAWQGYRVHATDLAEGMLGRLQEKVENLQLHDRVSSELCSYSQLDRLKDRGPYDLIFSNFAGLNCTGELSKVLSSFSSLLKPGGQVVLVLLPGFCLWESLLVFKGKFRTATRRWFSRKGVDCKVEGHPFRCWYYSTSYVVRHLKSDFELMDLEGLCTIVPPSYIEQFAERYPSVYRILCRLEDRWKGAWPWRSVGDYYIIRLQKKG